MTRKKIKVVNLQKSKGLVALLDILGFKELMKLERVGSEKSPSEIIFQVISAVSRQFSDNLVAQKDKETKISWNMKAICYADTFLCKVDCEEKDLKLIAPYFISSLSYAIAFAYRWGLPLRGGISYGDYYSIPNMDSSCFGKAFYEAYLLEQCQEWCGCLLSKDLIVKLKEVFQTQTIEELIIFQQSLVNNYKIPLKDEIPYCFSEYAIKWPCSLLGVYHTEGKRKGKLDETLKSYLLEYKNLEKFTKYNQVTVPRVKFENTFKFVKSQLESFGIPTD